MKLGAYTACLHDRSLPRDPEDPRRAGPDQRRDQRRRVHARAAPADRATASRRRGREDYLGRFAQAGITLTGLNVNGNPLNPDPEVGPKHAADLQPGHRARGPARGEAGGDHVRPARQRTPAARYRVWVVNPWDSQYLDVLDYQWKEVAVPFWKDIQARAAAADVKVCIEMHPHNMVFNPATLERLVERDQRHPRRRGDGPQPPVLAGHRPGRRRSSSWVTWCSTRRPRTPGSTRRTCQIFGVLDDRFPGCRRSENPVGIGGRNTLNEWPQDPSWEFVAVGRGHDQAFWVRFLRALAAVDPDMAVNIEHEDQELDQLGGLRQAAEVLIAAKAEAGV